MDEKRKGEIALAIVKIQLRQDTSLRDIANIRRDVGNIIKDPEIIAIKATDAELFEIFKNLLQDVFEKQMKMIP